MQLCFNLSAVINTRIRGRAWRRGACVAKGGHTWWEACVAKGACMVKGACMAKGGIRGGGHAWQKGGHAWYAPPFEIQPVIAWAVRILLECILVYNDFSLFAGNTKYVGNRVNVCRRGSKGVAPGAQPPLDSRFWGPKIEHFWALFNFSIIFLASLRSAYYFFNMLLFRWFKFTLKPPYSIAHGKLWLAIWDTSFWTFWVKFGHKGPWDIS